MVALAVLAALVPRVLAATVPVKRQAITTLSTTQVDFFTPYSNFAAAAYCTPAQTADWGCGSAWAIEGPVPLALTPNYPRLVRG